MTHVHTRDGETTPHTVLIDGVTYPVWGSSVRHYVDEVATFLRLGTIAGGVWIRGERPHEYLTHDLVNNIAYGVEPWNGQKEGE